MLNQIIEKLSNYGQEITLSKDQIIFNEGDSCKNFLLIKKGSIKVFKVSPKGQELTLYRVNPDHLCILTSSCLLAGSEYPAIGMAETPVSAIQLSKKEFDELIVKDEKFRELVFSSLSERFSSFVHQIDEISFSDLKDRVLKFLEFNQNENGFVEATHQKIANELGVERETISRLLKRLNTQNIIRQERGKIYISNQ